MEFSKSINHYPLILYAFLLMVAEFKWMEVMTVWGKSHLALIGTYKKI